MMNAAQMICSWPKRGRCPYSTHIPPNSHNLLHPVKPLIGAIPHLEGTNSCDFRADQQQWRDGRWTLESMGLLCVLINLCFTHLSTGHKTYQETKGNSTRIYQN